MSQASKGPIPFLYVASKPRGGSRFGLRQAGSRRALAESLRSERQVLRKAWALPAFLASEVEFTLADHVVLNTQLAQLLSRGVPLVESLEVVASTVRAPVKARVLRMRELVSSGSSFADAGLRAGKFDTVTVAVYRAAERTGDLAGAAEQLATKATRQLHLRQKAVTMMIYPAIIAGIGSVVGTAMLMFIVPRIGKAIRDATGTALPPYTEVMVTTGDFLRANWLLFLATVAGIVIAGIILRAHLTRGALAIFRRLPMIRALVAAQELARFFSVMAAMSRAGVPLADALGTAELAVTAPTLRRQLTQLRQSLIDGGVLRVLIERVEAFPLATRRLLIAADRAGDLDQAFDGLASDMTEEVDRRSMRLIAALEPAMIVILFLFIGTILVSVLVPLMTMSSKLGA